MARSTPCVCLRTALWPSTTRNTAPHSPILATRFVRSTFRSKAVKVLFELEEPEIVLITDVRSLESEAIVMGMRLKMDLNVTPDGKKQMVSKAWCVGVEYNLHRTFCKRR